MRIGIYICVLKTVTFFLNTFTRYNDFELKLHKSLFCRKKLQQVNYFVTTHTAVIIDCNLALSNEAFYSWIKLFFYLNWRPKIWFICLCRFSINFTVILEQLVLLIFPVQMGSRNTSEFVLLSFLFRMNLPASKSDLVVCGWKHFCMISESYPQRKFIDDSAFLSRLSSVKPVLVEMAFFWVCEWKSLEVWR